MGPVEMSDAEVLSWLRQRLESRAPTAVVRVGDGEWRLLRAHPDDLGATEYAKARVEAQSGRAFSLEATLEVAAAVKRAVREADVLGVLSSPRNGRRLAEEDRGHLDKLALDWPAEEPPPLTGCHISYSLLPELPDLLIGRRLSLVSCRDIGPVIEEQWNVADVAIHQIPSQHNKRYADGAYEATMHDLPIWPDAHKRILAGLRVREPGEVFLVGAGVFGKDLCIEIRDRGGIALDMGAALDVIAGKVTRGLIKRFLRPGAGGTQAAEIAALGRSPAERERVDQFVETIKHYMAGARAHSSS